MQKTKTLYLHVVNYNWDKNKFEYECYKKTFYINPDDTRNYYYDKEFCGGFLRSEVGDITYAHGVYYLYTAKLPKEAIMNIFNDYFQKKINKFTEEQSAIRNAISKVIYETWKEVK